MAAQAVAAIAAAAPFPFCTARAKPMEITNVPAALLGEFLFTFALAYVVLNVATAKATPATHSTALRLA